MDKQENKPVDWERIEIEYRAGVLSLREIAESQGISHQGIAKRAKASGWERNLAAKIKAKADSLVAKQLVDSQGDSKRASTEKEVIEANAEMQSGIILSHRTDVRRARKLAMSLLAELEHQTDNLDLYRQLAEIMAEPDEKGQDKRNDLFNKVINLSSRTGTMKSLADSLKTLVALEREAFGIDSSAPPEAPKTQSQVDAELVQLMKKAMNGHRAA